MFSGIFSSISLYIILGLVASTASLGWLSVHNYRSKVEAESALVVAINANTDMKKSLNLKDLSCKIDDKAVVEVTEEKILIDEAVAPVNDKLQALATVKPPIKQPIKVNNKENPKDESIYLPDDGLLSPAVNSLLNEGWCAVYPTNSECVSK